MTPHCSYHCRACGAHFSSLRAFDAHRSGPMDDRRCDFPDDAELVERTGICKISDPTQPQVGVTLYERADSQDYRSRMEDRQAAPRQRSMDAEAA